MERQCLVQLRSADLDFAKTAEQAGWHVAARSLSGLNWLLRSPAASCSSARQIAGVEAVNPATTVVVTLEDNAPLPQAAIEKLGGVVLNKLQNVNVATLAIPEATANQLRRLPGVQRVRKDYTFSASPRTNDKRTK